MNEWKKRISRTRETIIKTSLFFLFVLNSVYPTQAILQYDHFLLYYLLSYELHISYDNLPKDYVHVRACVWF